MPITQTLPSSGKAELFPPFLSALIIVLFLFFIDEGYYNFNWMANWGNWIVFVMYMAIFFPIQWLISHFLFAKITGWKKIAAMVGLTVPLTLLLLWLVF